jgi:hypothetical protein
MQCEEDQPNARQSNVGRGVSNHQDDHSLLVTKLSTILEFLSAHGVPLVSENAGSYAVLGWRTRRSTFVTHVGGCSSRLRVYRTAA